MIAWIPLVGWLLAAGVKIVVWIFAFLTALLLTILTVSIAWIYYRPLYGIMLMGVVALGVGLMFVF